MSPFSPYVPGGLPQYANIVVILLVAAFAYFAIWYYLRRSKRNVRK